VLGYQADLRDFETARPDDPPPRGADVIWHCFVEAEVPVFARLFKRVDTGPAQDKLDGELRTVLSRDERIELVPEP
jgi:hypothetical protein